MFEVLLYASLSCKDAADVLGRVKTNTRVSEIVRIEVIETVKESTPECNWDAND
jgi:hypothetical protein